MILRPGRFLPAEVESFEGSLDEASALMVWHDTKQHPYDNAV